MLFAVFTCFSVWAQESKPKEVSPEERTKEIVDHLAKKIPMTKGQKDSIATAFLQFVDDIQKYNALGNEKIIDLLVKTRDDKVKKILHDDTKFDEYLLQLVDMKKQMDNNRQQQMHQQHQQGGHRNPAGSSMPGGGGF